MKNNNNTNKSFEIFLDSACVNEINSIDFIKLDGITTNPSIAAKNILKKSPSGSKVNKMDAYKNILFEISKIITSGPISAEVVATEFDEMILEALEFSKIAKNICIKLPITKNGLKACKVLTHEHGLQTNMTLCFSAAQAILAAKNGATYVSPFIGRLDDVGVDGIELIRDIKEIFSQYHPNLQTKILAASVRNLNHFVECAKIGVDSITVSASLLQNLYKNPLTDAGLEIFTKDWDSI